MWLQLIAFPLPAIMSYACRPPERSVRFCLAAPAPPRRSRGGAAFLGRCPQRWSAFYTPNSQAPTLSPLLSCYCFELLPSFSRSSGNHTAGDSSSPMQNVRGSWRSCDCFVCFDFVLKWFMREGVWNQIRKFCVAH